MKKHHLIPLLSRIASYYGNSLTARALKKDRPPKDSELVDAGMTLRPLHPFHDEANLENISGTAVDQWGDRSRSNIQSRLRSQTLTLHPFVIHHVRNAALIKGNVYTGHEHYVIDQTRLKDSFPIKTMGHVGEAALAHTFFASIFWGHWLSFELPAQRQLEQRAPLIGYRKNPKYQDEPPWRSALGLPDVQTADCFMVEHLMIASGTAESITCIREHKKIRHKLGESSTSGSRRIYIQRPGGGSTRTLTNEANLILALEQEGYTTVNPGLVTLEQLQELCRNALEIVGIEGSHLVSTMYLAHPESLITILQPPNRVTFNHNDSCHFLGITTAIYVCRADEAQHDSFNIDAPDFLKFLEKARIWRQRNRQMFTDYSSSICA
jgi:capsular polysaccharide biosynthesis protein